MTAFMTWACRGESEAPPAPEANTEAAEVGPPLQGPVPQKMRTVQLHDRMVEQGRNLFTQCIACHGKGGEGTVGLGPRLNSESFLAAASDDFLVRTITKGRAGTTMIPWGQAMSQDDIYALVAYIRSWQDVRPAALNEDPLQGDESRGQALFANICSGCHGRNGAGYQETANGTGILRAAFLSDVSNGYLRYIIQYGKSQTKMKGFREESRVAVANLSGQQIDDVITYLRRNAW
jgi:cbb3-type cytochrome c oxidase subunit III